MPDAPNQCGAKRRAVSQRTGRIRYVSLMQPTILSPDQTRVLVPELTRTLNPSVWLYRFRHPAQPWTLSIATHAEPGSDKLSLGGFRIAPKERTETPGFNPDVEAIELAIGMEEKVYWSRLLHIGGPLARRDIKRIVGGKCVLEPTPDARVGQPNDFTLLDWAIECFRAFESTAGVRLTTGQDLGHGVMSDGNTKSLDYLSERFPGSVDADTSKPTAEGNYWALEGMLRACRIPVEQATVGLIGLGNIGMHVLQKLRSSGARVIGIELREERRAAAAALGATVWLPTDKCKLLEQPIDALVVNAAGGSLDADTVRACAANETLRVVCGSENLALPNPDDAERLRESGKSFCPTELGGMMGYLTAVEEYLAHLEGQAFDVHTLFEAAKDLEPACYRATALQIERNFTIGFEEAVRRTASESVPAA